MSFSTAETGETDKDKEGEGVEKGQATTESRKMEEAARARAMAMLEKEKERRREEERKKKEEEEGKARWDKGVDDLAAQYLEKMMREEGLGSASTATTTEGNTAGELSRWTILDI